MKKNLPDIIRENENFRQVLLAQEGGIMKYWTEHPDADGLEALRRGYREQCARDYREEHKWDVMSEDVMKQEALAEDHIKKELVYMEALKPLLLISFAEVAEQTISFIEDYLDYAFIESHRDLYSDSIPPLVFYDKVIGDYNLEFGKAGLCLWLVLKEYRGTAKTEKDEYDLWMEFEIRQYARIYYIGCEKLRQAIKETIDKNTQGKDPEECRRICRNLAIDTMKKLERFVHRVNGDYDRVIFYEDKEKQHPVVWSSNKLAEILNVDEKRIKRDNIEIAAEEMAWLRVGMHYSDIYHGTSNSNGLTRLQYSFSRYYDVLMDIGHFWAAQLLRHGIDMQELEKENHTTLIHQYYRIGYLYYVDRLPSDHRGDCCVYDAKEAKELLDKIKHRSNPPEALLKEEGRPMQNRTIVLNGSNSLYVENITGSINIGFVPERIGVAEKKSEAYFNNIENQIVKDLDEARVSIHVAIAWFTNQRIADKLIEKFKEGLDVKVVSFNDHVNYKFGVDIGCIPHKLIRGKRGGIMHDKFCVIDNQKVITGSYNWSENAENKNDENTAVLYDNDSASKYSVEFRKLFEST